MVTVSGLVTNYCSVLINPSRPKLPIEIQHSIRSYDCNAVWPEARRVPRGRIQYFSANRVRNKYAASVGRTNHQLRFDDDLPQESFWLSSIKEAFRALKSLFVFLVEQPSQLKYIEWPSFPNTLRTASLTFVLVAMFIVALSSIDSALCYLLALILRRPA